MYYVVIGCLLTLNRDKGSRFKDKAKLSVDLVNDINLNQCWHFCWQKKNKSFPHRHSIITRWWVLCFQYYRKLHIQSRGLYMQTAAVVLYPPAGAARSTDWISLFNHAVHSHLSLSPMAWCVVYSKIPDYLSCLPLSCLALDHCQ